MPQEITVSRIGCAVHIRLDRAGKRNAITRSMYDAMAEAIVEVVDTPFGTRPFRVHIDPTQDGAEVAFAVIDRVRNEMLHRVGFSDLLKPRVNT